MGKENEIDYIRIGTQISEFKEKLKAVKFRVTQGLKQKRALQKRLEDTPKQEVILLPTKSLINKLETENNRLTRKITSLEKELAEKSKILTKLAEKNESAAAFIELNKKIDVHIKQVENTINYLKNQL